MNATSHKNSTLPSLSGLSPVALAFLLSGIKPESWGHRCVLLLPSELEAESTYRDFLFFLSFRTAQDEQTPDLLLLPGWDQSPYRNLQPSPSKRMERIKACGLVHRSKNPWLLISTPQAFLQAAPSREFIDESIFLQKGDKLHPDALCQKLLRFGYSSVESVEDPGTFCLRGGILDLFSPSQENPVRLDFFDDEIESIRIFNAETQRSISDFPLSTKLAIIPVREFPSDPESLMRARERLKDWCDNQDLPKAARDRVGSLLNQGILTNEMDYLIPFFRDSSHWVRDLLPEETTLVEWEPELLQKNFYDWQARQVELFAASMERQNLVPEPEQLYAPLEDALAAFAPNFRVESRALNFGESPPQQEKVHLKSTGKAADIKGLLAKVKEFSELGTNTILVANSQSQIDRLLFLLNQNSVQGIVVKKESDLPKNPAVVSLCIGTISESFHWPEKKLAFISEDSIFGAKSHSSARKAKNKPVTLAQDLTTGDLVVHIEHGIGKYLGLARTKALGSEGDFALVEYSGGDKLYVPVYRLESLSRYVGAPGASGAIDKLGTGTFQKTKDKVRSAIKDIAVDLLRVQAERTAKEGFAFSPPDDEFRKFEAEFPFDETIDQAKAIRETLEDMQNPRPMDRLICGDVGFGKTEVAIRAAFKAAQDGKQVAVLVPTTILAEQHYLTFSQRMAGYPLRLASISRFKNRKEQAAVAEDLAEGKIDIIIGTHRLLSKDIRFRDLGLLIIDEEQRFGVEHKEKLKQLRATTDVLTLTATPIPRTLQMSLMGLKDVSIIRTPPGDRLSIKTHLASFDTDLIRSAIKTELGRGGQVFFIHNRIQTIGKIHEMICKLVPESKPVVAHGQMAEGQLEKAMIGFYQKQFDVLIATAIIENGLDVPNANTLIVDRADTFGLSQLYQIRGRVGRSQTRAFAYFLVPETASITEDARERLSVLQRFVELGSGYTIATYDLEIRGGGDVLGQAQSGNIASVGYELYVEMLQAEIMRLKGQTVAAPQEEVEINVPFSALLPQSYVEDMKSRLILYRRLSATASEEEVEDAKKELEDRYGAIPKETNELLWILRLKVLMRRMGLKSLTLGPKGVSLVPGKDPVLSPAMVMALVNNYPKEYSILPEGKFVIRGQFKTVEQVHDKIRKIFVGSTQ